MFLRDARNDVEVSEMRRGSEPLIPLVGDLLLCVFLKNAKEKAKAATLSRNLTFTSAVLKTQRRRMIYVIFQDYRLLLWGEGARRADEGFQAFPYFTQI